MEEIITINIGQLEELLKDKEYAKEWKASKYNELLKENIRIKEENKWLKEHLEYWDKEYINLDEKVEGYRSKYIKWKRKTKELRGQEKQMRKVKRGVKCNKCNEYGYHACKKIERKCYTCGKQGHCARDCKEMKKECNTCGKIGHKQKDCFRNRICEKCNKEGHTEKVCRNRKLERKED